MWAAVAFAAHCARTVFPQFLRTYPAIPPEQVADVERAVFIAEILATLGKGIPNYAAVADGDHAVDVGPNTNSQTPDFELAGSLKDAAAAAAYAADMAAGFTSAERWAKREDVYRLVRRALDGALASEKIRDELLVVLQELAGTAHENAWTDSTPVSPAKIRDVLVQYFKKYKSRRDDK